MSLRGTVSLSPDQVKMEMAKEHAIAKEGRKFIPLRLIDITKNRIQGAIVLHATPYLDTMTNMNRFHFEERGGPLEFHVDDMRGAMYCRLLDCEHNRKFLASMYSTGIWEIEDKEVNEEVRQMAAAIRARALTVPPVLEESKSNMSDDDIDTEMARLQVEKSRRKIAESTKKSKAVKPITAGKKPLDLEGLPTKTVSPIENNTDAPKAPVKNKPGRKKLVTVE